MAPPRNRRPGFSRRAQYGLFLSYVVAGLGVAIGAVLLVLSTFHPAAFAAVRGVIAELTTPVSSGLLAVRDAIAAVPENMGHYIAVTGENARLRKQVADERAIVLRARTLARENARLRALLKVRDVDVKIVVAARLVSSSASSTRRFATLNAGSWQGVRGGQPVRGPDGLIGRVIETTPNSARILLISDPESVVPVRRTRDGAPALATGRGDGLIDIRSAMSANMPFAVGDVFVTSGAGGLYPPNVPVTRVSERTRDAALGRPFANPDALDFAIVQRAYLPEPPSSPVPKADAVR